MNKKQYKKALKDVELLLAFIEEYEKSLKPMLPDPIEAIEFRMHEMRIKQKDLIPYIGCVSHVSEVMNKKKPLNLRMVRSLHEGLGISAEVLIQDYKLPNG